MTASPTPSTVMRDADESYNQLRSRSLASLVHAFTDKSDRATALELVDLLQGLEARAVWTFARPTAPGRYLVTNAPVEGGHLERIPAFVEILGAADAIHQSIEATFASPIYFGPIPEPWRDAGTLLEAENEGSP